MLPTQSGSFRLFRLAGIDVFVHWTWLLVAVFQIEGRQGGYENRLFHAVEYLTLFGIVLLHELGHATACRQVGGVANQIVLWPLGGVAYVMPPPRPGAVLWSIAAGPLVNLLLVPLTVGGWLAGAMAGLDAALPDVQRYLGAVSVINLVLLVFNMLPVYPLDGGQILQALLWFVIGRAHSLAVASAVGLLAGLGAVALAFYAQSLWFGILAAFVVLRSWNGWQASQALRELFRMPRSEGFACPACGEAPLAGENWNCAGCGRALDVFAHGAACPACGTRFPEIPCGFCHHAAPAESWVRRSHK